MEKTIHIGEKAVKLKATASFVLRYKSEFGEDILVKLTPMISAIANAASETDDAAQVLAKVLAESPDFEAVELFRIVYILAKTADPDIGDFFTWLDGFDHFPLDKIIPEAFGLVIDNLLSTGAAKKKKVKTTATAKS